MFGVLVLQALADPVRREIVERLVDGELGAGEIARAFPTITRPAVSRHLRLLREAGLVTSRVAGQERIYTLDRRPLGELDTWLERFRPLTTTTATSVPGPAARLDALDTEMARGRRHRRRQEAATDEGDPRGRTTG
ncbi:ArsR/SmtB family transcription factor [Actinomycetospora atypica]|uniref:ArsR/SmtB family transcription factor n=1 Tax=Actinomycetospora atypica TaxID=1290095 RepID=A0ABV9YFT6_9PSEU